MMLVARLIVHGLLAVALLGAITHQLTGTLSRPSARGPRFLSYYAAVRPERFTRAVIVLFVLTLALGATLYPAYRVDVRIPFEEMSLGWAVGLFEIKEHIAGVGLGTLPLYAYVWRPELAASHRIDRCLVTLFFGAIAWFDFIVGHVLNNMRGLT
jgi:hypothetical protein